MAAAVPATAVVQASPANNIVSVASANPDFSTLVSAVQAADLATTLSKPGPYTVFAPTNAAFGKLPAGTVDTLLQPANKATLAGILTYHVVSGRYPASRILAAIRQGGGSTTLTTVQGGTLTAKLDGSDVVLTDAKGGTSRVTATDVKASNGVIHVIDTVVMP
ncbi:fasciclin domain-containing protein [Sphingomonas sp. BN140010]|uniref:Fasciclin domain-containing protein n=2 Tax=Sphingomonas arvum TaxID=2992113 RepID=A0ABT3JGN2_9SPHN|nr:fasciclin domain-containing protein [Sphingomonas sp. BN140010]MCW3798247.1 fasciclin domain-containing protein [Sphingomonas sp. BN140010]